MVPQHPNGSFAFSLTQVLRALGNRTLLARAPALALGRTTLASGRGRRGRWTQAQRPSALVTYSRNTSMPIAHQNTISATFGARIFCHSILMARNLWQGKGCDDAPNRAKGCAGPSPRPIPSLGRVEPQTHASPQLNGPCPRMTPARCPIARSSSLSPPRVPRQTRSVPRGCGTSPECR